MNMKTMEKVTMRTVHFDLRSTISYECQIGTMSGHQPSSSLCEESIFEANIRANNRIYRNSQLPPPATQSLWIAPGYLSSF